MSFNESNTNEQMILDAMSSPTERRSKSLTLLEEAERGWGGSLGKDLADAAPAPVKRDYHLVAQVLRQPGNVMVEGGLRDALIRLDSEMAAQLGSNGRSHLCSASNPAVRSGGLSGPGQLSLRRTHGVQVRPRPSDTAA
jgi:hypothetical protein